MFTEKLYFWTQLNVCEILSQHTILERENGKNTIKRHDMACCIAHQVTSCLRHLPSKLHVIVQLTLNNSYAIAKVIFLLDVIASRSALCSFDVQRYTLLPMT